MNLVSGNKNIASIERPAAATFTELHPSRLKTVHRPAGQDYMTNGWKPVPCVSQTDLLTGSAISLCGELAQKVLNFP